MNNVLKTIFGLNNANLQEIGSIDDSRISFNPTYVRPGEDLEVHYHGLLKESGADQVYLHYGFDNWNNNLATVPMNRLEDGCFKATIKANGNQELNFCFKDSAANWDNNNGYNWIMRLQL